MMAKISYEPDPLAFNAEPKFPPHEARILSQDELASIMSPTFNKSERAAFDRIFSDMQERNQREVLLLKAESVVLSLCLIGLGALGMAAFFLLR
jgi:hypothetical protein